MSKLEVKSEAEAALLALIVYRLMKGNPGIPPTADAIKQLLGNKDITLPELLKRTTEK